jgi:hypothetical protein
MRLFVVNMSPRAPPSPSHPSSGRACPVCATLELSILPLGKEASTLEYRIEPGGADRDALREWFEKCCLCRLVYDLDQQWSNKGNVLRSVESPSERFWFACGRNGSGTAAPNLQISADWGESLIHLLLFKGLL